LFPSLALQNVLTGPEGDTTITVSGNVQFKETIVVTKKKGNGTDHEKNYIVEVGIKRRKLYLGLCTICRYHGGDYEEFVFWEIKPEFVLHRRHIKSPL
jgi:hypothetical protein